MSKKLIIAVDLDDVLSSSAQGFVDYSNKRWGTRLTVEEYDEHWGEMWGVDHEEVTRRAHDIYDSDAVGKFKHSDEAKPVLKELSKKYSLVITTSRHIHAKQTTLEWINKHYKGIFDDIYFAGIWDKFISNQMTLDEANKRTKAELCQKIGASYLIDDHPKHCIGAAEVGVKALLFGEFRWSRNVKLPAGVTRVKDWQAVLEYFKREAR